MLYFLYALFFISCFVLIATVLLQPGKTDAGALFTSNVSSSAFGPRGTASVLSKLTIAAACIFMLTALLISMPALQGNVSVLQSVSETPVEAPVETTPTTTDTNTDANAAASDASNTETPAPPANTATEQAPAN